MNTRWIAITTIAASTCSAYASNNAALPTPDNFAYSNIVFDGHEYPNRYVTTYKNSCGFYENDSTHGFPKGGPPSADLNYLYSSISAGTYTSENGWEGGQNFLVHYEASGPDRFDQSHAWTWQVSGYLRTDHKAVPEGTAVQLYFKADFAGANTWTQISRGDWTTNNPDVSNYKALELKLFLYQGSNKVPIQSSEAIQFSLLPQEDGSDGYSIEALVGSGTNAGPEITVSTANNHKATRYTAMITVRGGLIDPYGDRNQNCSQGYEPRLGFFLQHSDSSEGDSSTLGTCCMNDGSCTTLSVEDCASEDGNWISDSACSDCPELPGDVNADGSIDALDLDAMHAAVGICTSDVNHDGDTNVLDLLGVIDEWGGVCP